MLRVTNVESELAKANSQIQELQRYSGFLENKLDDLENRSRRQNLVIHGLEEDENENWETTREKVKKLLQTRLEIQIEDNIIQRAHRTGKKIPGKSRPIVCKFLCDIKKEETLRASKKLRGSSLFISQDYPYTVRNERRKLQNYMHEARVNGKYAYLSFRYLFIDGRKYSLYDIESDSSVLSPSNRMDHVKQPTTSVSGQGQQVSSSRTKNPSPPSQLLGSANSPRP